jgi:hypothetical protein
MVKEKELNLNLLMNNRKFNIHKKKSPIKNTKNNEYTKYLQHNNLHKNKLLNNNNNNNNSNKKIKVYHNKDINKSKHKFTKKSQEKNKKRKSKRKKIHRRLTKTKNISFKCNYKNNIDTFLKETKTKSNEEIKTILKNKGIDIKSNKKKLLRDIYLFASCDNINIIKE